MKIFFILILIAGIGYFGWNMLQTAPSETIPQAVISETTQASFENTLAEESPTEKEGALLFDNQNITIGFTGYGPGKEHPGTLTVQSADLVQNENGDVRGTIVVDMNSINADVPAVSAHLKRKDFFDVALYPTTTFIVSSLKDSTVSGKMTLRGITKDISFPVVKTENTYTAEFRVNMEEFGIKQTFANNEFVVRVVVPFK